MRERGQGIADSARAFPGLGEITSQLLCDWVAREFGVEFATSSWIRYGNRFRRLIPCSPILHIVSGETPHAALQSLIRGILVGSENWIKLPSTDLVKVRTFVDSLPKAIQPKLSKRPLPGCLERALTVMVFGSERTIQRFAVQVRPWQRFAPHGHIGSIAIILGVRTETE